VFDKILKGAIIQLIISFRLKEVYVLDVIFADDSKQDNPSRTGMGPLVAIGSIYVPGDKVKLLEDNLEGICTKYGFPPGREGEFKWSPGKELWMHDELTGQERQNFFLEAIGQLQESESSITIVVSDRNSGLANPEKAEDSFEDVTFMLLERIDRQLLERGNTGIVVTDTPPGNRSDENKFLQKCLETITSGTRFVKPERIAVNVLSSPSRLIRCLQMADVVTSASLAFISGENTYSPKIFSAIKPLLNNKSGIIGGIGVKIHPDFRYTNLYHWLLGDSYHYKDGSSLPLAKSPYAKNSYAP
jgi:hypothetical protein